MALRPEVQSAIIKVASDWALADSKLSFDRPKNKVNFSSLLKNRFIYLIISLL